MSVALPDVVIPSWLYSSLLLLGAFSAISLLLGLIRALYRLLRPATSWASYRGEWAIVTGASYGIGRHLADGLARRGINVILVARSAEKLEAAAAEIRRDHQVQTVVVACDLTLANGVDIITAHLATRGISPSVLVNNVGGGVPYFKKYMDWTLDEEEAATRMNGSTAYRLIRRIAPAMLAAGRGRLVNVGSFSHRFSQMLIPYAAEKAKLRALTQGLYAEWQGTGVEIQYENVGSVLTPGYLTLAPDPPATPTFLVPSAAAVAESILQNFGNGGPFLTPLPAQALQYFFLFSVLPRWVFDRIIASVFAKFVQEQRRKEAEAKKVEERRESAQPQKAASPRRRVIVR